MIINYFCDVCRKKTSKVYDTTADIALKAVCKTCGALCQRSLGCPSSNTVEVVDNGFMENAVEYDAQRAAHLRQAAKQHSYNSLNAMDNKL